MVQEVKMTHEEQFNMYMKLSKKEIITMLIEANRHLQPTCSFYISGNDTGMTCKNCGEPKHMHHNGLF